MIRVDCSEVLPIKHDLMVYVADQVEMLPTSKQTEFTLSSIEESHRVKEIQVVISIENFLSSIGQRDNFDVLSKSDKITIKSKNGVKMEGNPQRIEEVKTHYYTWEVSQGK